MATALPSHASIDNVYSYYNGAWSDKTGTHVTDETLLRSLRHARDRGTTEKSPSGTLAYVPIRADLDAVVVIRCYSNYHATTLHRIHAAVHATAEFSKYEYAATYMTLTGLVNKEEFTRRLSAAIQVMKAAPPADPSLPTTSEPNASIAVIAIDLDFFKQVNDNYGHDYGDVALKALAMRLTNAVTNKLGGEQNLVWELGHLSGEEFALFVGGPLSPERISDIAESLREAIGAKPLPSDEDLIIVGSTVPTENIPEEHERHLTISVGLATEVIESPHDRTAIATRLMQQADTAMYRAKTGGRNCVRRYSDILMRLGRVLEYHESPPLVAIDIGSNVGVSPGQEFQVFHPSFGGTEPFVVSDGRTTKRLGTYPRRPYASIVADDVQPAMSFCKFVSDHAIRIERGSHLEAVPLGTISRSVLTTDLLEANPSLLSPVQLSERATELAATGQNFATLVFALRDVELLLSKGGTVAVNTALTRLYDSLRHRLPMNVAIGKAQTTELAVLMDDGSKSEQFGRDVVTDFRASVEGRVQLSCGAFQKSLYDAAKTGVHASDTSDFSADAGIDLARYAAASSEPNVLVYFTPMVATELLARSRNANRLRDALSDFNRLARFGLVNASCYSQAAVCAIASEPPQAEAAADYIARARSLEPKNAYFVANAAWIETRVGSEKQAVEDLISAYNLDREILRRSAAYCYVLFRALLVDVTVARHFDREEVRYSLNQIRQTFRDPAVLADVSRTETAVDSYYATQET